MTIFSAATALGQRDRNDDVFLVPPLLSYTVGAETQVVSGKRRRTDAVAVFAVADGVGSLPDSRAAASAALSAIENEADEFNAMPRELRPKVKDFLYLILDRAQQAMLAYNKKAQTSGSSTIALLLLYENEYYTANIGDSPVFLVQKRRAKELSVRDNAYYEKLRKGEKPSKEDARVLLKHLGDATAVSSLTAHIKCGIIKVGDRFILATDGVTNELRTKAFVSLAKKGGAAAMVAAAEKKKGSDNCTAIVVDVV